VLLVLLFLALAGVMAALGVYAYYASTLPSPEELHARAQQFKSTKILDRQGRLLFEVFDPLGGRRTLARFGDLPNVVIESTIATEDATFFTNPGFSPLAIASALYRDLRAGALTHGGSTITQQLVKNLYLTRERTLTRKVQEAILAAEITRRYSKATILELYLNESYYGNLAYGIEAAAETYFGKNVAELNLAQAAMLAGVLQSPAIYDPYTDPEAVLARRATVLRLMTERGYISAAEGEAAAKQPLGVIPKTILMEAPHFVMFVREQLERQYGTEGLYRGGLIVHTTLDLDVQHQAEAVAKAKIAALREQSASNTALVALDPQNGDILAMLGSVDFYDRQRGGQVNVTRRLRQPGSTIKPLTYLAAFERGWNPATMLMDVAQEFPDGANPPYKPRNYDNKEYGPVSLRTALACSRNIPAVSTLYQIGLPALLEVAHRLGIQSLDRPDYGLSLTLGGGDVTLLELTGAYATLANGGRAVAPRTILRIEDQQGRTILAPSTPPAPLATDPRHVYLLTDILSDDQARRPTYGANSPLKLSFPAAAKTGTTNDYRDSWTIGYTPNLVTGVWVGNNDNTPMKNVSGGSGAAFIWHDFMERALANKPHPTFARPAGIVEVEVCPVSGQKRGPDCPPGRKELVPSERVPQETCTVHRRVEICKVSGKLATRNCPRESVELKLYEDYGAAWDTWAQGRRINTPPRESCPLHQAPNRVAIEIPSGPQAGIVTVRGTTEVAEFSYYFVEYGVGTNPAQWTRLTPQSNQPVREGALLRWDTSSVGDGVYLLRLVVVDAQGRSYQATATVEVRNATAIPTATLAATHTLTPTVTTTVPRSLATVKPTRNVSPEATPTDVSPTATSTLVSPTVTPTRPAATSTRAAPSATPPSVSPTATSALVSPTATSTLVSPAATSTLVSPAATSTLVSPAATSTLVSPAATPLRATSPTAAPKVIPTGLAPTATPMGVSPSATPKARG
jgi:1A family penicillin-binding protein